MAILRFVAVFALAIRLIYRLICLYLPGVWRAFRAGNKEVLSEYIRSQNRVKGAAVLWVLCFVQVLLIFIPLMPIQIVAGMTYGTIEGSIICITAAVSANILVFTLAGKMTKVIDVLADFSPKIKTLMDAVKNSQNKLVYVLIAFLVPGFPNGALPYAAANAKLERKTFLKAAVFALPIPTVLSCFAGHLAITGNVGGSMRAVVVLFVMVGLLFLNRDRVSSKLSAMGFN